MPEYSRLKKARLPIRHYIDEVKEIQNVVRRNPIGVDTLSDQGYNQVIINLEHYENDINQQDPDVNVLWAILKEFAPYFTFVQYMQLGELAHNYLN